MIIPPEKCAFGQMDITFLTHSMNADRIAPLPAMVDAVHDFPTTRTTQALSKYLGMINHYHRFIPGAAQLLHPLHCTCDWPPASLMMDRTDNLHRRFQAKKAALTQSCMLSQPFTDAHLVLRTDLSIGASLEQWAQGDGTPSGSPATL